MNGIYLDNNATTPMLPAVWEAMRPFFCDFPGNPASSHRVGQQARRAVEDAREEIAALLDALPDEVIFTSGATEANNLAVFGLAGSEPAGIVTSFLEHPSVLAPIQELFGRGFPITYLPATSQGVVKPSPASFKDNTRLVAVMLANHETGAVQPVENLTRALNQNCRAMFHCDAAAAAGKLPISFKNLGVSTLTISAHKFHGPKGVGALLIRRNTRLRPLLFGGHQQQGKRPGTEPVPLIVGMAKALSWSVANLESNHTKVLDLRKRFLHQLRNTAASVIVNGPEEGGLPHAINLSFPGCPADALLMSLDLAGVACSTGSACSSGSLLPSPVLQAMHVPADALQSAMRFSLNPLMTVTEIDEATRRISHCVNELRRVKTDPD